VRLSRRSELLVAQADATVEHTALGFGELVREPPRPLRADARSGGDAFGCPVDDEALQRLDAVDQFGDGAEIDEVVREQRVHDREQ
jgi:hypothetical protein